MRGILCGIMRACLLLAGCLLLSHCAQREPAAPPSPDQVEWYIARKEPLTFCPKGQHLPDQTVPSWGDEYVYLADRRTRFYIPPKHLGHRSQALALRQASLKENGMLPSSTQQTFQWVAKNTLRLLLLPALVSVGGEDGDGVKDTFAGMWQD